MKLVTLCVALWHSADYLPSFLASLQSQTLQDFELIVFDNGPKEDFSEIRRAYPGVQVMGTGENQGFAPSFNQMMREAKTPYVLVINQDIILHPHCVESLLHAARQHPDAAAIVPKLFKAKFGTEKEIIKTDLIDTTGLQISVNRHVEERGSGKKDKPWISSYIFGGSGACVLYKKEALDAVQEEGDYFDSSFIAYKEDIDLAYRLQWAGFQTWFESTAIGWHFRGIAAPLDDGIFAQKEERKKRKPELRRYSYANHWRFLIKNEDPHLFFRHVPFIFWYEIRKFFFLLGTEPQTVLGACDVWRARKELGRKRTQIMAKRKKTWQDMRMFIEG